MLRLSSYLRELAAAERHGTWPAVHDRRPAGPVVIWNLVRRCNLACTHCYAFSADHDYPNELTGDEANAVLEDLQRFRVPFLILSGGEPLLRPDLFEIAARARALGLRVGLSTNGTLIDGPMADRIAAQGFDYVGISLDGLRDTHDRFRRKAGAFDASLGALRHLRDRGVAVGLRYTMTGLNGHDLPALLALAADEGVQRFYFSHLNYAGRGNLHRARDARFAATRAALDLLIDTAWRAARDEQPLEIVTGNNDADAVYLLHWAGRQFPHRAAALRARLAAWGGNASGVNVANIDNEGRVHPDTMWWHHDLGSVRERPFSAIWSDRSDPLMAGLAQRPRPVGGRCGRCAHLELCGGNTRVRAEQVTGDPWAEDPGCYLDDDEIGLPPGSPAERLAVVPFAARKRVPSC